ncbi:MAG: hypothetical protein E5V91_16045 [Mesorhizobium sp.]|nr:MAG: hypothetical protein E5V91_16045 [Mesorhizobium sp.]
MSDRTPTKTFGLKTPSDLHHKLVHDISRLRSATSSDDAKYAAFDCAVDAWHLTDWVLHAVSDTDHLRLSGRRRHSKDATFRFTAENSARLPALEFCRQIANSVKHVVVTRGDRMEGMSTGATVRFDPPFCPNEPETWKKVGIHILTYIEVDDQRYDVIELFEDMASQWYEFLVAEGLFVARYFGDE